MENKLEWIKDLMSLHSQSLKFFSTGKPSLKQELKLLSAVKVIFNEYFNQRSN